MAPFEFRVRPTGSEGETVQDVTVPPLYVGTFVLGACITWPLTSVKESGLYTTFVGGASFTTNVSVAELLPPVLVAVTA